jgi:hypothetical protein
MSSSTSETTPPTIIWDFERIVIALDTAPLACDIDSEIDLGA